MKTIKLYGDLAQKFGDEFKLDIVTPAEGIRALSGQLKGFADALREGEYHLIRGEDLELQEADQIRLALGKCKEFHIIPKAVGAKRGGLGKAIIGIAVLAAAFYFAPAVVGAMGPTMGMGTTAFAFGSFNITFANIALFGASMALSGIGQMLTPVPKVGDYGARERPEERPSFLYTGPINAVEQGQPVAIPYGEVLVGSVVISGSLSTEQIATEEAA